MAYLPALQPRIQGAPATAQMQTANLCQQLRAVDEDGAWGILQLVVNQAVQNRLPADQICSQLTQAAGCRSWTRKAGDVRQLLARHCPADSSTQGPGPSTPSTPNPRGCGGPGKCDCGPCGGKKESPMSFGSSFSPNPGPQDWSSACGGYRMPDPAGQGLVVASSCDVAACTGGSRVGLERIPYNITLVPGVTQTITHGFTRPARMVAMTFTRYQRPTATLSYNPDNIYINEWKTDSIIQAYDLARQQTSFAGVDQNTIPVSLVNYFEDGANGLSPVLNAMNFLPTFIPPTDIGSSDGLVQYNITLDAAAPANETVFYWAWILFTGKSRKG